MLAFIFSCSSDSDSSDSSANIYEQDLAGSWTAYFCEPDDATSCTNQNLVLALDGTGSVSNSWTSGEQWSSDLEWSATASSFTLTTLIDDDDWGGRVGVVFMACAYDFSAETPSLFPRASSTKQG